MGKAAYAVGTIVILALSYIGLKALISVVASATVDAVFSLFTSPIRPQSVDRR